MKVAIMQPYLFPYLGYFQLIQAVDAFVVYDDVNYIKGGWINRNYILSQGNKQLITLQVNGASSNKFINQVSVGNNQRKVLATIKQNYSNAPYYSSVLPLLEEIIMQKERNLVDFVYCSIRKICEHIDINVTWYISSNLDKDNTLCGQDKVIAICNELGASQYINTPGGMALYDKDKFSSHGITLTFIKPKSVTYPQFSNNVVPNLSIIDVLMFNSRSECAELLKEYDLV